MICSVDIRRRTFELLVLLQLCSCGYLKMKPLHIKQHIFLLYRHFLLTRYLLNLAALVNLFHVYQGECASWRSQMPDIELFLFSKNAPFLLPKAYRGGLGDGPSPPSIWDILLRISQKWSFFLIFRPPPIFKLIAMNRFCNKAKFTPGNYCSALQLIISDRILAYSLICAL